MSTKKKKVLLVIVSVFIIVLISIGTYALPSKRYYDKYSYGTSETEYTRGKLGDATIEMAPTDYSSWYEDYADFVSDSFPWFMRGGNYDIDAYAGTLSSISNNGGAYDDYSARAAISNLN